MATRIIPQNYGLEHVSKTLSNDRNGNQEPSVKYAKFLILGFCLFPVMRSATEKVVDTSVQNGLLVQGILWIILSAIAFRSKDRLTKLSKILFNAKINALPVLIASLLFVQLLVFLSGQRTDIEKSTIQLFLVSSSILPYMVIALTLERAELKQCALFLSNSIMVIASSSILLDFSGVTSYESFADRHFGFLGDGVAWLVTLPVIIYYATSRPILLAVSVAVLMLTLSRGAIIVLVGAFILFLVSRKISSMLSFAVRLLIALLLAFALAGEQRVTAIIQRFEEIEFSESDRVSTSQNGFNLFLASPIYGSGFNSLAYYYPQKALRYEGDAVEVPSSTLLQMLSDGGIIVGIAYIYLVVSTIKAARRLSSRKDSGHELNVIAGLASWITSMLLFNHSASWFFPGSYLTPIITSACGIVGAYTVNRREDTIR
jgi:hypothetical protein